MRKRHIAASGRRLIRNHRASTIVEFAIVAPVLILLLLGAFDIAHTLYMRAVLQGVVQKASRDSTLESAVDPAVQAALDTKVRSSALALANDAQVTITRRFYRTFAAASAKRPEHYEDNDGDMTCNHGEPFDDDNNNGVWDSDGGDAGQGGAKDRTVYTVMLSYPRIFPVNSFIGGSSVTHVSATTVWENQPYGDQGSYGASTVGHCA